MKLTHLFCWAPERHSLWVERRPECAAAVGAATAGERVEAGAELARHLLVGGAAARHQDTVKAGQAEHRHQQHADHAHNHQTGADAESGTVKAANWCNQQASDGFT